MRRVLYWLGAPQGRSATFYRDFALTLPFGFGSLIALLLAFEGKFTFIFLIAVSGALVSFVFMTKRRAMVAGVVLFAALRFAIGFVFSQRISMLVGALVCCGAGLLIIATDGGDYSDY